MVKAYQIDSFGLKNLKKSNFKLGQLAPDEVRVQLSAVSLNYRDLLMIKGHYNPRMPLPVIPVSDGAGTVVEVGSKIRQFKVGDRVCTTMIPDWSRGMPDAMIHKSTLGGPCDGCLAEYRDFHANEILPIPDRISFEEAATLPVAGLTAYNALQLIGRRKSAAVLLLGTGGVSLAGLGIAKRMGFDTIITSSSDTKLNQAKGLGADATINYKTHPNWSKEVKSYCPKGVDLVLEVGGSGTFDQSANSLSFGGKMALIGVLAETGQTINLTKILMYKIAVHGIIVGSRKDFQNYLDFVKKTGETPHIGEVLEGMDSIHKALEILEEGSHFGKIVIRF